MAHTTQEKLIHAGKTMVRHISLIAMAAAIVGVVLPAMAAPLPREPMPKPGLSGTFQGTPKPPVHIGTRPRFNPSNIGALPDLKIISVRTRINSRVAGICRAGRKTHPQSSIEVLNFVLVVKNVGRGTAYMNRDGVIVSAQTMDFRERVFDTSKYYLGGRGGPGHFIGPHGRQNWILKRMAHVKPGRTFTATSHLGVGYNNRTFTIRRLRELAGQTHRFRIKLTSYGRPGLKESNTRNNEYIVRYTFPRNFCQSADVSPRPVGVRAPNLLPDLKIIRITSKLNIQASEACRTGLSPHGGLVSFNLKVKNIGAGVADLRSYNIAVHGTSVDGQTPSMRGGDGYSRARRTPARVASGQTFNITGASGVVGGYYGHPVTFPVSRYSELAGKTRRFKVEIMSGSRVGHGLVESNYRNNSVSVNYTFPRNFCTSRVVGVVSAPIGRGQTVKPNITGFQFAGGKRCVSPRGIFTIKGSTFGRSAGGRTIELGGNGRSVNLLIKSWNNRAIRVQLPRTARLQYRKNYWVAIRAAAPAGRSNLKRGVVLCSPTVRTGTSGSSGNPPAGRQNGGRTVTVAVGGLPDLEVSRLTISNPSPACFSRGIKKVWGKYYTLPKLNVSLTLHNKGRVPYSTFDAKHNKQLPIGIIADKYVGPKDRHNISLCLVSVAHMTFSNLNIPAGGSKTIQTQMQFMSCSFRGGRVVNYNGRLAAPLVRTLLGVTRPVKIGIGKPPFIRNKIPKESNYDNNFGRTMFRFPSSTCGGR